MKKAIEKYYPIEILIGITVVMAIELTIYIATNQEYSNYIYFKSVVEIFIAPFYPGVYLISPCFLGIILAVLLAFVHRLASLKWRISLNILILVTWSALGLFTIIKWYH